MSRVNKENIPDEKLWFSEQRLINLQKYNEDSKLKILDLEKKFGHVCFTPLSIPLIKPREPEKFRNWYFDTSKLSIKQNKDIATQYTGGSSFRSIDLLPKGYDAAKSIWSKNIVENFNQQWPDLWEQFYEFLPFEKIEGFSMWSSTKDILPHRDQSLFLDIPLEFRVLLDDPNPEPNLFIGECLPNFSTDQHLSHRALPNHIDTNSFVWNNLRSRHYSNYNEDYKKIIMIFHWTCKINWKKYEVLIEKSLDSYKEYSLLSERTLQDYIRNED